MASARPSRRPVTGTRTSTAVAAVALALTGCSATNPITTSMAYNVVDGVQADLSEEIQAHSLLVFTAEEGAVGTMSGALVNRGREDVSVTLQPLGSSPVTIDVPARGTVLLGSDAGDAGEAVEIDSVAAPPGAALTVEISAPEVGSLEVDVPVFDGTLPEYQDVVPEPEPAAP